MKIRVKFGTLAATILTASTLMIIKYNMYTSLETHANYLYSRIISTNTGFVEENRQVVKRFVMTKVEKTGSSTLHSILTRFIIHHNLSALTACDSPHISWQDLEALRIGPGNATKADTLVNHAIYNRPMIQKYIQPDYKHIVLVREPVSWFKSAVKYFVDEKKVALQKFITHKRPGSLSPEEVISDEKLVLNHRQSIGDPKTWFHLPQLQWYGFHYRDRNNLTAIKEFIANLVPKMDIIFLSDQFEASLIMLKRSFGWTYLDIFYSSYKVTNASDARLSAAGVNKLLSAKVNLGEHLLYKSMNKTWWRQPVLKENNFWEEVSHFKKLNAQVQTYCMTPDLRGSELTFAANSWHPAITVTDQLCFYLHERHQKNAMVKMLEQYCSRTC